ncbi:MAG: hypothetical protein A2498_00695 [Lentisphaerae bacterium RIFOXYC12_FULL_60_16]|nr:MAG: hypothetical protein A2498_00695 [Lentisphaerae bacterium RIFOXYC12_FULL_60_16]OGV84370.1 MAG: hypothetical protein A2340_03900 [Lentisphaerae bacterium RIFOXYB12_FULL_60_10]
MKPVVVGVIPARWASTRFPGKILTPLLGRPLIHWVLDRVRQAKNLSCVVVATDDVRIAEAVRSAGGLAVMTRPDHPSGTDRVAEAVSGQAADVVVNIQGDEPLVNPVLIDSLADALIRDPSWDMATAVEPLTDPVATESSAVVKVVMDRDGRALYFSRAVIPHERDRGPAGVTRWRHIGIYAYRRTFLDRLVQEPPCDLEQLEKLEQLRALHIGARIAVIRTESHGGAGVDLPDDVPRVEAWLRRMGHGGGTP